MSKSKIRTDHKWRQFKNWYDVDKDAFEKQVNLVILNPAWIMHGFFKYKGRWFSELEFRRFSTDDVELQEWDGIIMKTKSTGLLIKRYRGGGNYFQIGTCSLSNKSNIRLRMPTVKIVY